jgi:hypothetical protein
MTALDDVRRLYDVLPDIDCKGLCWNACGVIDMSEAERARTVELGVDIPLFTEERAQRWANDEKLYCPALSFNVNHPDFDKGRVGCSIYEDRPMICRLWGLGEGDMSCPHGCVPLRRLTPQEVWDFIMESYRRGGHRDQDVEGLQRAADHLKSLQDDPETAPLVERLLAGDLSVRAELEAVTRRRR